MAARKGKLVGRKIMTNGKKVYVDIKPIDTESRERGILSNLEVVNPITAIDILGKFRVNTKHPKVSYILRGNKVILKDYWGEKMQLGRISKLVTRKGVMEIKITPYQPAGPTLGPVIIRNPTELFTMKAVSDFTHKDKQRIFKYTVKDGFVSIKNPKA